MHVATWEDSTKSIVVDLCKTTKVKVRFFIPSSPSLSIRVAMDSSPELLLIDRYVL